jgi:hypothetical protein
MSQVTDLTVRRILRKGEAYISVVRQQADKEIADILTADITKLNGWELRRLRDCLISLQVMQALAGPETRGLIAQKVEELGRDLAPDEALECAGPIKAIKFSLA